MPLITINNVTIALTDEQVAELKEQLGMTEKTEKSEEWPKLGDQFWVLNSFGDIDDSEWNEGQYDKAVKSQSGIFRTREAAEMQRLRNEARVGVYIPEFAEKVWIWSFLFKEGRSYDFSGVFVPDISIGNCRKTKEEAEEWGKKYAHAFEFLIKNPQ